jgi:hypothetical protein
MTIRKKTMKILYLLPFFTFFYVFTSKAATHFNSGDARFYIQCKKNVCVSNALINGKKVEIFSSVPENSTISWHGKDIGELHMSCGSPCSSSIYVDFKNNKISHMFSMPIKVDKKNKLILFVNDDNKISVAEIFGKKSILIEKNFSPTASLFTAISSAEFLPQKILKLEYLTGEEFKENVEFIDLKNLGF